MIASKLHASAWWPSSAPGTSNGVAASRPATAVTWSPVTYRISARSSTNRLISHGQAMRSTLGRSRVTHFMIPSSQRARSPSTSVVGPKDRQALPPLSPTRLEHADDPVHPGQRDQDEDDVVQRVPDALEQLVEDVDVGDEVAVVGGLDDLLAVQEAAERGAHRLDARLLPPAREHPGLATLQADPLTDPVPVDVDVVRQGIRRHDVEAGLVLHAKVEPR